MAHLLVGVLVFARVSSRFGAGGLEGYSLRGNQVSLGASGCTSYITICLELGAKLITTLGVRASSTSIPCSIERAGTLLSKYSAGLCVGSSRIKQDQCLLSRS